MRNSALLEADTEEFDTVTTIRAALRSPAALAALEHPVAADCWCRPQVSPVWIGPVEVGCVYIHNYGRIQ